MDPQQPDNGQERTLPSQHGQMISNLSTRPNISERNDPSFDDEPNQQRPLDIHTDRLDNQPTFSQRIISHRSQSFDQGINPHPAHFSAPPHLNQHHLQQQGRENIPILNNVSNERVYQSTTFNKEWERSLNEEEKQERDYENHVLFNQENEPLLTQQHEIKHYDGFNIYSDNEPLLSQTMASDQHFQSSIDNEPLLTQKNEPAYQLNSIHQSNYDGKSEASVSNQVKFVQQEIINEYFSLDSGQKSQKSHHSSSAKEFPQQPLFQIEFKDDTQSNLLKFGFTVKKKETNPKEQSPDHQLPLKPDTASFENKHQNKQVVINQPVIHLDATSIDPINHSVHAENGSSGRKSLGGRMELEENQPIKRTLKSKNLVLENEKTSLQSGKVTKKIKYKSKGKGKTTSKKATVKFDQQSNESEIVASYEQPISIVEEKLHKMKRNHKSIQRVVADSIKKGVPIETYDENLGTKFTFLYREDNQSNQKEMVQRRVSQRLAEKASNKKEKANNSSQKGQGRLRSHSSKKKYEEYQDEELNIDYIIRDIKKIKFRPLPYQYLPLTRRDKEIYELFKKFNEIQDEQSRENNIQQNEDYNNAEPDDNTASVRSQTKTNSMIRKEEIKKSLSKYKPNELPIVIQRVVDPDINRHGIYALLELGRLSQMVHNARFALTAITGLSRASKKLIEEDLSQAKRQAGDEKDNLVVLQPSATILDLVKAEKEKRAAQQ